MVHVASFPVLIPLLAVHAATCTGSDNNCGMRTENETMNTSQSPFPDWPGNEAG